MVSELPGVLTAEKIDLANQAHATNFLSLVIMLVEKGICTTEELHRARIKAQHIVDQEWALKRETAIKEFDERYPGVRELFGQVLGGSDAE